MINMLQQCKKMRFMVGKIRDKADLAMTVSCKVKSFSQLVILLVTSGDEVIFFDGKDGPMGRPPVCVANGGKQIQLMSMDQKKMQL